MQESNFDPETSGFYRALRWVFGSRLEPHYGDSLAGPCKGDRKEMKAEVLKFWKGSNREPARSSPRLHWMKSTIAPLIEAIRKGGPIHQSCCFRSSSNMANHCLGPTQEMAFLTELHVESFVSPCRLRCFFATWPN